MTDKQLREAFGLTENALSCFRNKAGFPQRDELAKKTDSRAVESFFDRRAGIASSNGGIAIIDGEENFHAQR